MSFLRACLLATSTIAIAAGVTTPACAEEAKTYNFDIGAQSLEGALVELTEETHIQLIYSSDLTRGLRSGGVHGTMTAENALQQILGGTGLSFRVTGSGAVTIDRPIGADGEIVTGAVRVEGSNGGSPYFGRAGVAAGVNGINGSRDITATEGTKSFTSGALTIGSKVPQAMKDVPQSLSVLTSERLQQQNVTDFTMAMRQLPGVTLEQGASSLETTFYSRGFAVNSIQVDGGAPLTTNWGYSPQIDMSVYDHVELLRGAAGQFNFYGDPGGTVNLVRKKPLDHPQYTVEGQVGSWSNYRVVADATSPLALDGRLRGRLVMTYQNNHYFYDTAKDNKQLIYGIVELDATPTTLLTAGINYTKQDSVPWYGGLPRYQTGDDLKLPRSTSIVFPWNRWNFNTTEFFGGVEQRIADDWTLKVNLTRNKQRSTRKVGFSTVAVNPDTGLGPRLAGLYSDSASKQLSAEATLTGAFNLFGQRQEVTIGANRVRSDGAGQTSYASLVTSSFRAPYEPYPGGPRYCFTTSKNPATMCPAGTIPPATPPIDVFDFNPNDPIYTEPRNPLPTRYFRRYGQTQAGAYINLRLTAFDRLHLTTGLRWSRYEAGSTYDDLCTPTIPNCVGMQVGDVWGTTHSFFRDDDISWPPPVNLSFDVTKSLTAYAGYTNIYLSQGSLLDVNLKPIAPVTGANWEAGLKWAPRNGRLNLSLSAYRINQRGFGTQDGDYDPDTGDFVASNGKHFPNGGQIDDTRTCCWKADPNATYRSQGVDLEATGEVLPGWQVAASYNYNDNKFEGTSFGSTSGTPLVSIQPRHLYKLWMTYDFGVRRKRGPLSGLSLSLGLNGQSSGYHSGTGCKPEFIVTNPVTGAGTCGAGGSYTFAFTVPSRAVLSGAIDYRISDHWSVMANLENILDKTYYQTVGSNVTGGNWYGTPRSVTATLRAKF
jgi:outer membrane receptor for ferric coprogen and ferric-rhodotorulic acid